MRSARCALPPPRSAPSISYGSTNLYMRGALEAQTRPNLAKVGLGMRRAFLIL